MKNRIGEFNQQQTAFKTCQDLNNEYKMALYCAYQAQYQCLEQFFVHILHKGHGQVKKTVINALLLENVASALQV